jgi:hypothetical protein
VSETAAGFSRVSVCIERVMSAINYNCVFPFVHKRPNLPPQIENKIVEQPVS